MSHHPIAQPAFSHRRRLIRHRTSASAALAVGCALALAIGLIGAASPAGATMYKWVDDKGQTVYSDQPPPASIKSEIVRPPPPPANPNALKEMVNADTEMKQREKARIEKAKDAEKKRADAEKRQEMCAAAQQQLKMLLREDLYRFDAQGQRVYMDADARRQEMEQQQKLAQQNCA